MGRVQRKKPTLSARMTMPQRIAWLSRLCADLSSSSSEEPDERSCSVNRRVNTQMMDDTEEPKHACSQLTLEKRTRSKSDEHTPAAKRQCQQHDEIGPREESGDQELVCFAPNIETGPAIRWRTQDDEAVGDAIKSGENRLSAERRISEMTQVSQYFVSKRWRVMKIELRRRGYHVEYSEYDNKEERDIRASPPDGWNDTEDVLDNYYSSGESEEVESQQDAQEQVEQGDSMNNGGCSRSPLRQAQEPTGTQIPLENTGGVDQAAPNANSATSSFVLSTREDHTLRYAIADAFTTCDEMVLFGADERFEYVITRLRDVFSVCRDVFGSSRRFTFGRTSVLTETQANTIQAAMRDAWDAIATVEHNDRSHSFSYMVLRFRRVLRTIENIVHACLDRRQTR